VTDEPQAAPESPPTLDEIRAAREQLGERVRRTPVWQLRGHRLNGLLGEATEVWLKLELFQYAGSFKARGALVNMMALAPEELARGVCAVSAGNHAMAVGYAAGVLGTSAKVVMPRSANSARVAGCQAYGTEVVFVGDVHEAFDEVRRIERQEGRAFIHPFEGKNTILGTATVGLEMAEELPQLDAVIVPIGGGGLCAGVACAIKQALPRCRLFGVEPEGADSMHRSFASGRPEAIEEVRTIADSLGAPHAEPYSFALCRQYVDELVMIDDDEIRRAMLLMFEEGKLAVEPAGAAAMAALCGALSDRLRGRRVGVLVCGTNTDAASFAAHLANGAR
jgi:threonine dehydratase